MNIKDITNYQKNIEVIFIVIKELGCGKTKEENPIYTYLVADETGSIEFGIWGTYLKVGDIINITMAYTTPYKGRVRLFSSYSSEVKRIGFFTKSFKPEPNMSDILK
ncbi:hypothetical protein SLOPH_1672 [Spraguea lophii 42_110]|uniref:OB domain-containing protein n=1 Tax=Spraguea lophii (strain 42_110) TaxID=1358809 RepID=S7WAX9_SPRLO|nr:hypothetical protein SLOPH_1672 [Spraguea lophii 42_110]